MVIAMMTVEVDAEAEVVCQYQFGVSVLIGQLTHTHTNMFSRNHQTKFTGVWLWRVKKEKRRREERRGGQKKKRVERARTRAGGLAFACPRYWHTQEPGVGLLWVWVWSGEEGGGGRHKASQRRRKKRDGSGREMEEEGEHKPPIHRYMHSGLHVP